MEVKCKVISEFDDTQNNCKRRKIGEEFVCTLERAKYLADKRVIETIEVMAETITISQKTIEETEEKPKRKRTKKTIENEK